MAEVKRRAGRPPGLAVILVGSRPDSVLYAQRKQEACAEVWLRGGGHNTLLLAYVQLGCLRVALGRQFHDLNTLPSSGTYHPGAGFQARWSTQLTSSGMVDGHVPLPELRP